MTPLLPKPPRPVPSSLDRLAPAACGAMLTVLCLALGCAPEPGTPNAAAAVHPGLVVEWRSEPAPIPINAPFELFVRASDATGEVPPDAALTVEGWMPDHGHGMLRRPHAELGTDGWFHVEGMLFHMPGTWELRLRLGWREEAGEHFGIRSELATFVVEV